MKKKLLSLFLAAVLACGLAPAALAAGMSNFGSVRRYPTGKFTDVPASAWYAESVQTAYVLGLVEGVSDTAFNPEGSITIGSTVALAARLHSIYNTGSADFTQGSPWYQVYVDYAVANGTITPGQFADYNANATRRQFAGILAHALPEEELEAINEVEDGAIPDVADSSENYDEIYLLYRAGVLTGSDDKGTFAPETTIDRASVAAIVSRMAMRFQRESVTLTLPEPEPGQDPVLVQTLTISDTSLTLNLQQVGALSVTYAPRNAQNKFVTWTSSNPDVATVDNSGEVRPVAVGTTVITATTSNNVSASCTVTVTSERMSAYDFLASYIQTEGFEAGEEYHVKLDVNTFDSFMSYYACYDVAGDMLSVEANYSWPSSGLYSSKSFILEIPRSLTGPYSGTYDSSREDRILGTEEKESAAFTLDPASYAEFGDPLNFITFISDESNENIIKTQETSAAVIGDALEVLERDILEPNGYSLKDLGFTNL